MAQPSRIGSVIALVGRDQVGAGAIKGVDSAWDPVNDVYLVVSVRAPLRSWNSVNNQFGVSFNAEDASGMTAPAMVPPVAEFETLLPIDRSRLAANQLG